MGFSPAFEERIRRHLRELEEAGLRRQLQVPSGVDFSSNDYLGLAVHPEVTRAMANAVLNLGAGSTGSRLLGGNSDTFMRLEQRFARFKGTSSALFFGSGYAANLGVLSTFIERHDLVFCDERNHASQVDGIRLSRAKRIKFPHCDIDRLAQLLRGAPPGVEKFLVTESIFSMDGDQAPLAQYAELCRETGTNLIVDEAHAVGVTGDRGSGLIEETGTAEAVFLSVDTAGKALGAAGAFVCGPQWATDYLVQRARTFLFSTALPPAVATAIDASLSIIENEPERRQRLHQISKQMRDCLAAAHVDIGQSTSQIIPVILGDSELAVRAASAVQREGFDVRAIRPPAIPAGSARLRISMNSEIDELTVLRFVSVLSQTLNTLASCSTACS